MMWKSRFPLMDKGEENRGEPSDLPFCGDIHGFLSFNEPIVQSITIFICTYGLVETGIAIWFLGFHIKTNNPLTTYFLNLAVADFGILTFLLGFASLSITEYSQRITVTTPLKMSVIFLFLFTYTVDLCLLTAISMERCLSVCFPIWYRCERPKFISILVSFLIWFMSGLLYGITMIFYYDGIHGSSVMMIRIVCAGNIFILSFLMVVSTLIRFTRICYNSQQEQPRILWVTLPLTLIFFIFFAIPVSIFYFIDYLCYSPPPMFMLISFLLTSFNSTLNPLIYYVIGGQLKHWTRKKTKEFQNILRDEADSRPINYGFPTVF